jgi:hypothetical protein
LILQLQLITISHIEFGYFLYNRQIMSQLFFFPLENLTSRATFSTIDIWRRGSVVTISTMFYLQIRIFFIIRCNAQAWS